MSDSTNSIDVNQFSEIQVLQFRLSRIERMLEFILQKNPNIITPNQLETGQINLESLEDAKKGWPASYDPTPDDIKKMST